GNVVAAEDAVGDDRMGTAKCRRSLENSDGVAYRRHRQLDPKWTQELTRSEAGGHKHRARADGAPGCCDARHTLPIGRQAGRRRFGPDLGAVTAGRRPASSPRSPPGGGPPPWP